MTRKTFVNMWKIPSLALAMLGILASPSFAQVTVHLAAVPGTWTPPGGVSPADDIAMWGFIAVPDANTYVCPGSPVPWTVGPVVVASPGDTVTVNVRNCLSESVSVFIPGQQKATAPAFFADGQGRQRVRSFDAETAPAAVGSYVWTNVKEGSFLLHSGTHPQVQVQMGLYGALTVGNYGVADEATLVYSEIDPSLHAAVDGGTYGTAAYPSTFDYRPKYFLINGESYPDTTNIPVDVGTDVLLRFVNAGLKTHVPTLGGGLYMAVFAEDGNPYPGAVPPDPCQPPEPCRLEYSVDLSAGKTFDAILNVGTAGQYPLYDRALGLTNDGATGGGMLLYIDAGAAVGAPVAENDSYSVAEDDTLTADGVLPNPAGVLDNDTGVAAEAVLVDGPSAGTLVGGLAADGTFVYTPNPDFNGADSFTYRANDGLGGPDSNLATVTITVDPVNDPPSAVADPYEAVEGEILSVAAPGVLENDVDIDGDALTATALAPPAEVTLSPDGSLQYDATLATAGDVVVFDYQACDAEPLCSTATITITVVAAPDNIPPFANDDYATAPKNSPGINFSVTDNDIDVDGTIAVNTVMITTGPGIQPTQRGGTVVANLDGTVTYVPKKGFRGTDTFQYIVNDDDGAASNAATVRVNVVQ